jgi:DNA invertase Pin-like site-specific DNA recombinase
MAADAFGRGSRALAHRLIARANQYADNAPVGRFLLTQMASVAELEAGLISERTKAALAAAKARGVKRGNPNGARALRGEQTGNAEAVATIKAKAQGHAENLRAIVADVRAHGAISVRQIADALNGRDILTPRGGMQRVSSGCGL